MNKKALILLTGAHGFIGRHIFDELSPANSIITVGKDLRNDISTNLETERPDFSNIDPSVVIHAAGSTDSQHAMSLNFEGTKRLCEAIDQSRKYPDNFIYISSCAVYGVLSGRNIDEDTECHPYSEYGISKLAAENFLKDWCGRHGIKLSILRPSSVIGTGMTGRMLLLAKAINSGAYMHLHEYNPYRSYIHVSELAAIVRDIIGKPGIFNLTDGQSHSLHELADALAIRMKNKRIFKIPKLVSKILFKVINFIPAGHKLRQQTSSDLTFSCAHLETTLPNLKHLNVVEYLKRTD